MLEKIKKIFNIKLKVVVRIPPSPTGYFHIGRARTALFNYLFARQNGGEIVFRLEDTDKERSKEEYAQDIQDSLEWLGIKFDKGPFRQSNRTAIYTNYIKKMIANGTAYISEESEGANKEVIRFKNPNKVVTFSDMIRGEVSIDTSDLGDFVIARNINDPLYHLTVVVDDHEMGITHVIRGDDGISNTPRQILLQEAIDAKRPIYAHVPLILAKDKTKLSGRHGAVSIREYREKGYLPEAFVNFLAFIGWNPGTDQEIFSMQELIQKFDITKVQKGGGVFNEEKLQWFNKEYIRKISDDIFVTEIKKRIGQFTPSNKKILKLKEIILERINIFDDVSEMVKAGELDYFFSAPEKYDLEKIIWKKSDKEKTVIHLRKVLELISGLPENVEMEAAKESLWNYAESEGKGDVLWPTRYALSGAERSPDPFVLISILGKNESVDRIKKALNQLES